MPSAYNDGKKQPLTSSDAKVPQPIQPPQPLTPQPAPPAPTTTAVAAPATATATATTTAGAPAPPAHLYTEMAQLRQQQHHLQYIRHQQQMQHQLAYAPQLQYYAVRPPQMVNYVLPIQYQAPPPNYVQPSVNVVTAPPANSSARPGSVPSPAGTLPSISSRSTSPPKISPKPFTITIDGNEDTSIAQDDESATHTVSELNIRDLTPKDSTHAFVVPTDITDIVTLASSLVAEEIRSCHHGYKGGEQAFELTRALTAAAAIEQFAIDIILPGILASHAANIDIDSNTPVPPDRDHRVFIATLLSLREVLSMNAEGVFGFYQAQSELAGGHYQLPKSGSEQSESYTIKVQSLSTSLILNAVARLEDAAELNITEKLLVAITKYDGADEEFASCLKRADTRSIGITPYGHVLRKTENLAYRVAYNTARMDHPLVSKGSSFYRVANPPTNAAFVAIVERVHMPEPVQQSILKRVRREEVLERYKKRMRKFGV